MLGGVVVDFVDWDGGVDYVGLDCFCFGREEGWLVWCLWFLMGEVGGREEKDGWV